MRVALLLGALCAVLASAGGVSGMTPVVDAPYEQVIADRFLFARDTAECTAWKGLDLLWANTVVALPSTHQQAADGAWIIGMQVEATMPAVLYLDRSGGVKPVLEAFDCEAIVVPQSTNLQAMYSAVALCDSIAENKSPAFGPGVAVMSCSATDASSCTYSAISLHAEFIAGVIAEKLGPKGTLFVAARNGLHAVDLDTQVVTYQVNGISEDVSALAWSAVHNTLFVGTAEHLFIADFLGDWRTEEIMSLIDAPITSLTYDVTGDRLWIGQSTGITLLAPVIMPDSQTHWLFSRLAGLVSNPGSDIGGLPFANITALAVAGSDGRVWLGSGRGLMRFDEHAANPADTWRVFNSARYMPQRDAWVDVSSVAVLGRASGDAAGNTAVAITKKGIAIIRFEMWTLRQKADYMQTTFMGTDKRHQMYGLVSDCSIPQNAADFGMVSKCVKGPTDNDGLWTSIYLSSQVLRYAVTKDPAVLASASVHWDAMKFLQSATGVYGYPARSVSLRTDFPTAAPWHFSPTEPDWQFKGDTSSDEITGHMYIYPLVAELLSPTVDNKTSSMQAGLNIMNNIVENHLYLFGEYGNHTRWGVWAPEYINDDPLWQEGRGPNSLQILGWLTQAYAFNANQTYLDQLNYLLAPAVRYDINLLNAKMIAVCDSNFSDDELNYMSYFALRHGLNTASKAVAERGSKRQQAKWAKVSAQVESYMSVGLDMAQRYKSKEKESFYNAIYCYASGQVGKTAAAAAAPAKSPKKRVVLNKLSQKIHIGGEDVAQPTKKVAGEEQVPTAFTGASNSKRVIPPVPSPTQPEFECGAVAADAAWYLRRWPLEQVNWPQFNSDRLDVILNVPAFGCRAGAQSLTALPYDERQITKWNNGPYELDGGDGHSEEGVGPFLSGYWMMAFYGMLTQ